MDDEIKSLLLETLEMARENNEMLKKMRRAQKVAAVVKFLYWMVILGVAATSYYFIQPYVEKVIQTYNEINTQIGDLKTTKDSLPIEGINSFFDRFRNQGE